MEELGEARRKAESISSSKTEEAEQASTKAAEASQHAEAMTKERDTAVRERDAAVRDCDELESSMKAEFKQRITSFENRLQEATRSADQNGQRNRNLSQQLNYQEQLLAGREADFGKRIDAAEASHKEAGAQIAELKEQISSRTQQLDASKAEQASLLEQQEKQLKQEIEEAQQKLKQANEKADGLERHVTAVTRQMESTQRDFSNHLQLRMLSSSHCPTQLGMSSSKRVQRLRTCGEPFIACIQILVMSLKLIAASFAAYGSRLQALDHVWASCSLFALNEILLKAAQSAGKSCIVQFC